jgi:hypothetical protein
MWYIKDNKPQRLPFRLVLADGTTRTDPRTFTSEEIASAGYVLIPSPPNVEAPQRVDWVNNEWIVRDPTEGEINTQLLSVQRECRARLDASDYRVTKALEAGESVPEVWKTYRQRLRDIFNNIDVPDIWRVEWPEAPRG